MSRFRLVGVEGRGRYVEFELGERTVVGRDRREAHIVLEDGEVSRRHAEITTADGTPTIEDLGSTNGTAVNGERLERRRLELGDRVQVGSTVLELRAAPPDTQVAAPELGPAEQATVVERQVPPPPPAERPPHARRSAQQPAPAPPRDAGAGRMPRLGARAMRAEAGAAARASRLAEVARSPHGIAAGLVIAVAVLLAVAELILPGIAADRVRDELEGDAEVTRVEVDAFPALPLLWQAPDEVRVELRRYDATVTELADSIDAGRGVKRLRATVERLEIGQIPMRDARLAKDGERLSAQATIAGAALSEVAPSGFGVEPFEHDGELGFEGSLDLAAATVFARGRVVTRDGDVVVEPDAPFGGVAALTVFGDERLAVERVGARTQGNGFTVTAHGRLR
jgi:hypothetical protein